MVQFIEIENWMILWESKARDCKFPCYCDWDCQIATFYVNHKGGPLDKDYTCHFTRKQLKAIKRANGVNPVKGMSFFTVVPEKRFEYIPDRWWKLDDFCKDILIKKGKKYFNDCWYVIESGKHKDSPNLHIHFLADFKIGGSKHFKRDFIRLWDRYFTNPIHNIRWERGTNVGFHRIDCNTKQLQDDKLDYMTNSNKGTHENFEDLGISGRFSASDF